MDYRAHLLAHYPQEEVDALLKAQSGASLHSLFLNAKKCPQETLLSLYPHLKEHPFIENAYYYEESEYPLGKSILFNLGAFYILDAASMLPPYVLASTHPRRILDLCAAPGGKTSLLSMMLGAEATILSNDISYSRALETSSNVERLGLYNVAVTSVDFESVYPRYESYFDAILLDAPCSGSAMFRKDARLKDDWTYEKVLRLVPLQRRLLELAYSMLAPGGHLLYSTCSFSYEEDESVLLDFLKAHNDCHALMIPEQEGFYHHPDLKEGVHLFPHRYAGEGQFLCLIQKEGETVLSFKAPRSLKDKALYPYINKKHLEGYDFLLHKNTYYALNRPLQVEGLSLLRYGVKLGEVSKDFRPDHALSSLSSKEQCIPLSEAQAKAYLAGETFPLNAEDGFHVVRYLDIPLGYVKMVRGTAKNHYPKGLRRRY